MLPTDMLQLIYITRQNSSYLKSSLLLFSWITIYLEKRERNYIIVQSKRGIKDVFKEIKDR